MTTLAWQATSVDARRDKRKVARRDEERLDGRETVKANEIGRGGVLVVLSGRAWWWGCVCLGGGFECARGGLVDV